MAKKKQTLVEIVDEYAEAVKSAKEADANKKKIKAKLDKAIVKLALKPGDILEGKISELVVSQRIVSEILPNKVYKKLNDLKAFFNSVKVIASKVDKYLSEAEIEDCKGKPVISLVFKPRDKSLI